METLYIFKKDQRYLHFINVGGKMKMVVKGFLNLLFLIYDDTENVCLNLVLVRHPVNEVTFCC